MKYIKFHSDRGFHEIILSQKERQEFCGALLFANTRGKYSSYPNEGIFFIHDRHARQANKLFGSDLIPVQGPGFGLNSTGAAEFAIIARKNYEELLPGDLMLDGDSKALTFASPAEAMEYAVAIAGDAVVADGVLDWVRLL